MLVIDASTSMRGACRVMTLFAKIFGISSFEAPSWYTGRLWLMRLGYYKIYREKEKSDDWIWIMDHSIQTGSEKCLVILGIQLKNLPCNRPLTLNDVEPIELIPVKKSNGQIVYEQLEAAVKKTGVPREIISDDGPDLKSGIELFLEKHTQTCRIYDIKHKTATVLKKLLHHNTQWQAFLKQALQKKAQVQQTDLSFLAPPNQRSKARYMNVDTMIDWGNNALHFIESENKSPSKEFDHEKIKDKLHWIISFKDKLNDWKNMMSVIGITETFVRNNGLTNTAGEQLNAELKKLLLLNESHQIKNELLSFVSTEGKKAKDNERLLGSSEIIESLFGKQKMLENQQSKSGFTGLILAVGACVSENTNETIQNAMKSVETKTIQEWVDLNIGKSVQSMRKKYLISKNIITLDIQKDSRKLQENNLSESLECQKNKLLHNIQKLLKPLTLWKNGTKMEPTCCAAIT